jgi:hypothetical protein
VVHLVWCGEGRGVGVGDVVLAIVRVGSGVRGRVEVVEEVTQTVLCVLRALKQEGVSGGVVLDDDWRAAEGATLACVDPMQ